jgi:hypothetical protein
VAILNQRNYLGHYNWELKASGVKFKGGTAGDLITIQKAVDTVSLLLRDEYVVEHAAHALKETQS